MDENTAGGVPGFPAPLFTVHIGNVPYSLDGDVGRLRTIVQEASGVQLLDLRMQYGCAFADVASEADLERLLLASGSILCCGRRLLFGRAIGFNEDRDQGWTPRRPRRRPIRSVRLG